MNTSRGSISLLADVAGGDAVLLEVALVVFLGAVEIARRNNLRDDLARQAAGAVELGLHGFGGGFLCGVVEENDGAILAAIIGPLAVERGRIVNVEEDPQ